MGAFLLRNIVIWNRNICLPFLMTILLPEIFAGTEVIFVDEANVWDLQISDDSFSQMRPVSVLVIFLCVWGICVDVSWGGGVGGRGIIFRWREKTHFFLVDNFPMDIFKVVIFHIIICKITFFPAGVHWTNMGSKFVTTVMKKTPLHFKTSFWGWRYNTKNFRVFSKSVLPLNKKKKHT